MKTEQIVDLAIKRHDIDASHFQNTYLKKGNSNLSPKENVFLKGRKLVLDELSIVLSQLPKGSKILDVGCGTAHLTHWIQQQGFEVYGIEPSLEMFNFAVSNFPDLEIKQGISSKIPYPDQHFDLIVAFEVLRYLDKAENNKTFGEFNRVLKKDGSFFITQVNLYATDLYYFFHKVKSVYCKMRNQTHHFCNFTTAAEQEKTIQKYGFKSVRTIGRFMASTRLAFKFGNGFGNFYYSLMEKMFGSQRFENSFYKNFTAHLIVIAKK
jgi:ubiquinone/menaquinone biosynthesis C-methylase UbiE